MPIYTILFGVALMGIGVGTYIGSTEPSLSSFLLQMILGLLAIALGVGSMVKKEMRMHLMHGAILLAAMGVVVPTIRFVLFLFEMERDQQMQLLRVILTVAFSGAYVYLAVQSFRAARKGRKDGTADPPSTPKPDSDPAPVE
jgi:heme/copper-type cytochrome/quinol oxidase subunit 4